MCGCVYSGICPKFLDKNQLKKYEKSFFNFWELKISTKSRYLETSDKFCVCKIVGNVFYFISYSYTNIFLSLSQEYIFSSKVYPKFKIRIIRKKSGIALNAGLL